MITTGKNVVTIKQDAAIGWAGAGRAQLGWAELSGAVRAQLGWAELSGAVRAGERGDFATSCEARVEELL